MTTDADNTGHCIPDSAPMDAEDYPETAAGPSHGAGDAETELVPPATAAAPEHAWSNEEPVTEASSRPANARAKDSPMPRDAPVINTRFPRRSMVGAYALAMSVPGSRRCLVNH
jgi:hypothetical protein